MKLRRTIRSPFLREGSVRRGKDRGAQIRDTHDLQCHGTCLRIHVLSLHCELWICTIYTHGDSSDRCSSNGSYNRHNAQARIRRRAGGYAPASYYSIGKKSALKWEYGTKPTTATPGFFQIKDGAATDDSDVNIVATTPSGIVAARLDLVIQFKFKSSDIDLFTIPIRVTGVAWDPKTKQYPLKAVLKDVAKVLIDKINERRGTDFGPTHTVPAAVEATITVTPSIPQMAGAVSFFAAQEVAIPKAIPFSLNKAEPPKAEPIVIDQPTATETQQSQPKVEGAIKKSQPASHPAPVQPQ